MYDDEINMMDRIALSRTGITRDDVVAPFEQPMRLSMLERSFVHPRLISFLGKKGDVFVTQTKKYNKFAKLLSDDDLVRQQSTEKDASEIDIDEEMDEQIDEIGDVQEDEGGELRKKLETRLHKKIKHQLEKCRDAFYNRRAEVLERQSNELYQGKNAIPNSACLEALVNELTRLHDDNKHAKILIFAHNTHVIDFLSIFLQVIFDLPLAVQKIYGGTLKSKVRKIKDDFETDSRQKFLLLNHKSGGVGLNLQVATACVFVQYHWTSTVLEQAINRIHRINQRSNCECVFLVAKHSFAHIQLMTFAMRRALKAYKFLTNEDKLSNFYAKCVDDEVWSPFFQFAYKSFVEQDDDNGGEACQYLNVIPGTSYKIDPGDIETNKKNLDNCIDAYERDLRRVFFKLYIQSLRSRRNEFGEGKFIRNSTGTNTALPQILRKLDPAVISKYVFEDVEEDPKQGIAEEKIDDSDLDEDPEPSAPTTEVSIRNFLVWICRKIYIDAPTARDDYVLKAKKYRENVNRLLQTLLLAFQVLERNKRTRKKSTNQNITTVLDYAVTTVDGKKIIVEDVVNFVFFNKAAEIHNLRSQDKADQIQDTLTSIIAYYNGNRNLIPTYTFMTPHSIGSKHPIFMDCKIRNSAPVTQNILFDVVTGDEAPDDPFRYNKRVFIVKSEQLEKNDNTGEGVQIYYKPDKNDVGDLTSENVLIEWKYKKEYSGTFAEIVVDAVSREISELKSFKDSNDVTILFEFPKVKADDYLTTFFKIVSTSFRFFTKTLYIVLFMTTESYDKYGNLVESKIQTRFRTRQNILNGQKRASRHKLQQIKRGQATTPPPPNTRPPLRGRKPKSETQSSSEDEESEDEQDARVLFEAIRTSIAALKGQLGVGGTSSPL
jgi:hypothetical protein